MFPPQIRHELGIAAQPALTTPVHVGTKDKGLMGKETKDKLFTRNPCSGDQCHFEWELNILGCAGT